MKTHLIIACLIVNFLNSVSAQNSIPEFGEITPSELLMKECAFEKNASAMNLIKTAKITFSYNDISSVFSIKTEYSVRIKIFNKTGFETANIKIPYLSNSRYSKVTDIDAYIYAIDSLGKISKEKLRRRDIFREKTEEKDAPDYISFTFPDIKAGSVIEYKYTRVQKNSHSIMPWFFQDEIPTAISKITAVVPTYVYMNYFVTSNDPVGIDSAYKKYEGGLYNEDTRSYTLRNVHSFKMEPLMTSLKDNLERVDFSLSQSDFTERQLTDVSKKMRIYNYDLLRYWYFGKQFNKPIYGTAGFLDSVKLLRQASDKISSIYKYVKRNVVWNGEQSFICNDSIEFCWNNKSGNSAEMNILLINFLRKAGIQCFPILVSTRENGRPDINIANLSQFNGVDVLVKDSSGAYFLDCTQKNLSFKMPPRSVLNSFGYITDFDKMGWTFLMDQRILMKNEVRIEASIDSSGHVKGKVNSSYIGYSKQDALREYEEKKEKKNNKDIVALDNMPSITVDTAFFEPTEEDNDTLIQKENFHFKAPSAGNFFFLNPYIFSEFRKNPFIEEERFTDVDFGSTQSFVTQIQITIPADISVEAIPKNISLQKDDSSISFQRNIYTDGNVLFIRNCFVIKNAIFIKEDYSSLKAFFALFYRSLNEQIILKRKN